MQPNLVAGRSQVIGGGAGFKFAVAVAIGEDGLALGAKVPDRVAQFLHLGEAEFAAADAQHQALDARIGSRAFERAEHVAQIPPRAREQAG